jgi:hypothetical protein
MAACPTCGNGIDRPVSFCPHCGTRIAAAALAEEFKIVTVLFCDVVGSTELGRRLEDVPMRRVMDRYGEIVRGVLTGHGASVGRRHGDGFMAAFGIPELHEDDALRAVRAAAELRAALGELDAELQRERGLSLKVRIGINTGTVLVRDAGALERTTTFTTPSSSTNMDSPGSSCQKTTWPRSTTRRPARPATARRVASSSPAKGSTLTSSDATVAASTQTTMPGNGAFVEIFGDRRVRSAWCALTAPAGRDELSPPASVLG